jgi:hypothetical protein
LQDELIHFIDALLKSPNKMSSKVRFKSYPHIVPFNYEEGPKSNRNLNVARELEVVALCAARCRESTQYSSSLPRGVALG